MPILLMQDEKHYVESLLKEFEHLPRFPDGRINYAGAARAPVVTCFVRFAGRILLLLRSADVRVYQGKWCTVAGYVDEVRPIREKAMIELKEELGIDREEVTNCRLAAPYEFVDQRARKTWVVHPVLVELRTEPSIRLDREHEAFEWIAPDAIGAYDTVPMLERSLAAVLRGGSR